MGCSICGADNPAANRFCGTCGALLNKRLQVALAGAPRTARPARAPAASTTALSEAGS